MTGLKSSSPAPQRDDQTRLPQLSLGGNPRGLNVLVLVEHLDATYHVYLDGPLRALHRQGRINFAVVGSRRVADAGLPGMQSWLRTFRPDIAILSRYAIPHGTEVADALHRRGVPVVYHIDDDLLSVPPALGSVVANRHANPEVVQARTRLIETCDLLYASMPSLAEALSSRFPSKPIFAGSLVAYQEQRYTVRSAAATRVFGYMGSIGHRVDLAMAVPAIARVLTEHPSLEFEVFGSIALPEELLRFGSRVRSIPASGSYGEFLERLATLGWSCGLATLADHPFNRAKSPVKFVEYTAAGIPCVASRTPVYGSAIPPGAGYLVDGADWHGAITACLDDPQRAGQVLEEARMHCRQTYAAFRLTDQTNSMLLRGLASRAGWLRRKAWALRDRMTNLPQPLRRAINVPRALFVLATRRVDVERAGMRSALEQERVLYVANSYIPTLQLAFVLPLRALAEAGRLASELLSEQQLKQMWRGLGKGGWALRWVKSRFLAFDPTIVVFCRYSGPFARELLVLAKSRRIPTIFHVDDDLLNIPAELGYEKHRFHNRPERLAAVRQLLAGADVVYCSTPALLQAMRRHGVDDRGITGRFHCALPILQGPPGAAPIVIGYMGIDHAHDLDSVLPALVAVMHKCPEVRFELFGPMRLPSSLAAFTGRVSVHAPVANYEAFLQRLATLRWSIGICPLADTAFNALKANNKWVEYTSVGAAVVATAGTIYDDCCSDGSGRLVQGIQQWEAALSELVHSSKKRVEMVALAQAKLTRDFSVEGLRAQLLEIFELARGHARMATP